MPIYEYKCENGHVFDVIQRMTEEPLTECQECGAPAVRLLSAPAIHFKGSGFHNTDYGKKKSGGASGAAGEGSSSESKSSDSGSSDSKPSESKPDSKAAASAASD